MSAAASEPAVSSYDCSYSKRKLWVHRSLIVISLAAIFQGVSAQIPAACANEESLWTLTCCPNECREADGRGVCEDIDLPDHYNMTSSDVRANWPHYFTRACRCTGNYWGYDCSRCKYGYYGEDCSQNQTRPRDSIQQLTDEEWCDYIQILKWTRNHPSGHVVVLNEAQPGNTDIQTQPIHLYDLFVWLHHYAAKDNENIGKNHILCIATNYHFIISGLCSRGHRIPNMAQTVYVMVGVGDPVHAKGNGRSKLPSIQTALLGLEKGGADKQYG